MKKLIEKAEILIEALPYIKKFYGKTFVIKYGGAAQTKSALKDAFAQDVVLLNYIGINTVIVHGGGPKISEIMKKMGKTPTFIHGQRVTDRETIDIVEMVLGGLINKEIVTLINRHGGKAVGLTGKDADLIRASKKVIKRPSPETGTDEIIDLGLVGEVQEVTPDVLVGLKQNGFIPVVAPVGASAERETLNINADYVAASLASALKAEKLILMTDVPGILDRKGEIFSTVKKKNLKKLFDDGTISGGMIPKVQACVEVLKSGVGKTHILDGRVPHCLLLEIFTEEGIGTEIIR
ncbi:MAG TPA: acetylglutamate kinase [Nitrospirae bacterium]|nr:acetylglutamate kinase [Nitrospirota bacterium]